jgi:uncharacterized lipoprotein YddW (UPF0748 family)
MKRTALGLFICAAYLLILGNAAHPVQNVDLKMPVRGVWGHPAFFGPDKTTSVAKIQGTLDAYLQAGINTVIMLVKDTSGYVYFESGIGVADPAWNWDFFDVFIREAAKRKITVHPWFCVFPENGLLGEVRRNPEWLVKSARNEMVGAINPAIPEARKYELSLMLEVARKYPVDWIHLDYIRFPCEPTEPYFGFDTRARDLFKGYSGFDPLALESKDSGNMIWNEWLEWNRDQVTQFVRELKEGLKAMGRNVKISAAVFPNADNAKVLIGQDWPGWAAEGLVDMLCPMLYTNHEKFFEKFVNQAVAYGRGRCQVCPGIGIHTSHNQNTPEGMIEQMRISKALGSDGVIFFSATSLNGPFLDRLKARE